MNLEDVLLTNEQMQKIRFPHGGNNLPKVPSYVQVIKLAQAKKMLGWLGQPNRTFFNGEKRIIILDEEDWQALCRGLGLT